MKKILGLILGSMLLASASFAGSAPEKSIELGVGGGVALTTNAGFDLGFGGEATGLYRADENLGFGLGVGFHTFSITGLTGSSWSSLDFQALLKASFGTDKTKPYVLVGAGMTSFSESISFLGISVSASVLDPIVSGGVGLQIGAGDNFDVFVQAAADIVIATGGTFTYIPAEVGVNFDL